MPQRERGVGTAPLGGRPRLRGDVPPRPGALPPRRPPGGAPGGPHGRRVDGRLLLHRRVALPGPLLRARTGRRGTRAGHRRAAGAPPAVPPGTAGLRALDAAGDGPRAAAARAAGGGGDRGSRRSAAPRRFRGVHRRVDRDGDVARVCSATRRAATGTRADDAGDGGSGAGLRGEHFRGEDGTGCHSGRAVPSFPSDGRRCGCPDGDDQTCRYFRERADSSYRSGVALGASFWRRFRSGFGV
mmetsp:Transcript_36051/g.70937  ORF Transcript_36051/g.70937 Transcript_36051/m.70937 type:complete len:242 (+) Transcript_36051:256-981(+)